MHNPEIIKSDPILTKLEGLLENLSKAGVGKEKIEQVADVFQIETEKYRVQFRLDNNIFDIQALKVFQEGEGRGKAIVIAVHEFCDENDYEVIATDVEDRARGFWEQLGYQEGSKEGEFYRIG